MIEIDEIMPSRLGKILGITQKQAETLAKQSGLRIISETRMLPGKVVEPQPAFGLSIRREREVGREIKSRQTLKKQLTEKFDKKIKILKLTGEFRKLTLKEVNIFKKGVQNEIYNFAKTLQPEM